MKKACFTLIPLLISLCLFCAPHTALATEMTSCSVSVGQSDSLVSPGDTVTVHISVSVVSGSVSELSIQLAEVPGLNLDSASASGGWDVIVFSSSYLNVRGGPATAGSSVSLTLSLSFAPDAHGTIPYEVYNVLFIDEYGEPLSAGGGSATFEVHTRGTEWVVGQPPTCVEEGRLVIQCVDCPYVYEQTSIPMTAHVPGIPEITTPPTCLLEGEETTFCSYCSTVLATQPVPATGHTAGDWQTASAPTCTENGLNEKRCTTCSALLDTQTIAATGHTAGRWKTRSSPTCTRRGKQEKHCTVCTALLDTRALAALGHTPGEWVVTTRQTTEKSGQESLLCDTCGIALDTRELKAMSDPHTDSRATLPGEPLTDEAPLIFMKWPTYTSIDLTKPQVLEFPLVTEGGYVVGTVTVTLDENGMVTITYLLTAKGAALKAGAMTFLPTDRDWKELSPEDLTETPIDPNLAFSYTVPLDTIPQRDGFAMLCLNFVIDYDVYAERVREYLPEEE